MKKTLIWTLLVGGFALGFLVDRQFSRPAPETIVETKIKIETVRDTVEVEKIVYKEVPATLTYKKVFDETTQQFKQIPSIASADTTFPDYGKLRVDYHFPPLNYFNMTFEPFPKKIIRETRFVVQSPRWYKTQKVGFFAGVAATALTVYLVR